MTRVTATERTLASGVSAKVLRIDVEAFHVRPLFLEPASAAETEIARRLGRARLKVDLVPVAPAAQRLDRPVPHEFPGIGQVLGLSPRAAPVAEGQKPLAPLHLLRFQSAALPAGDLLVNANYFLFLVPELESPWDAYGDPIGLSLAQGEIETPPQMPRACLVSGDQGAEIRRIGFGEVGIDTALGSFQPHPFGPPDRLDVSTAFALFHGSVAGRTCAAEGIWDVAFVGRHAVAMKPDGAMPIPRAGCVLRVATRDLAEALAAGPIRYHLPGLTEGVQAGPLILDNGRVTEDGRDVFAEEHKRPIPERPDDIPVSPHRWAADWRATRAARLSAGITADGGVFFCAVEGTSGFFKNTGAAKGATLHDLAILMAEEGAKSALHLDGGGSTQVFGPMGGALVQPRDVNHEDPDDTAQIDRPLPLALHLS